MRIKDIVLIGMMSAVLVTVQVALGFLPNIELISLLIILFTLTYGIKTIFIIYVFVLVEGCIYGFGLWWMNYLYVWTILFAVVMLFRKKRSAFFWAVVCGIFGLSFGALCAVPYFFMGGINSVFAYWVNGIPFDIIHGIGNMFVTILLFRPLFYLLTRFGNPMEV